MGTLISGEDNYAFRWAQTKLKEMMDAQNTYFGTITKISRTY